MSKVERAYSTGSNGCLICPSDPPSCPDCDDDEDCKQTSVTCNSCATTTCVKKLTITSSGSNTGAIAGGVVGGVVFILLVATAVYWRFFRKKPMALGDDDIALESLNEDEKFSDKGPARVGSTAKRVNPNRRLSSYDLFTRPRAQFKTSTLSTVPPRRVQTDAASTNADRQSTVTYMSTTNASNILPIAYIPGVTVRPTRDNTRSFYSTDSNQDITDWSSMEDASIVGPKDRGDAMVAVRAQPRLVTVDRIEEEEEDVEEDYQSVGNQPGLIAASDSADNFAADGSALLQDSTSMPADSTDSTGEFNRMLQMSQFERIEEDDSDVDSDIGEIQRVHKEAYLDTKSEGTGSFILEVHPPDQ